MDNYQNIGARLTKSLQRLRDLHEEITAHQIQFLLGVAGNPGIEMKRLYVLLDSNNSVASRTLALLTEFGNRSKPGLELVRVEVDINDRRHRKLYLTPKGKRLMDQIVNDLT